MDRDTANAVTSVQPGKGPPRDTVLLGKYRVESTLGFGGMGLVIKAHNLALDEDVAIKILREDVQLDDDNITRFLREAKNAVRLKSEHVARIRDVGTFDDGRPYMVMELLEGLDLGKALLDIGRVDAQHAADLMLQTCDAIAEAHSLGIVHRDIKPTNLFVTKRRDGSELLKVLDFGISKAQFGPDMSLTQTSSMLGTPAYMSPEQMRNARTADPRSDIWSLGCVLYELVEGNLPFDASSFAELCVMVSLEPHAASQHAPELAPIIDRCLAKSSDDRYQNVGELAEALIPFASDPQRAQREVQRIRRMLANAPEYRDATPLPSRGSSPQLPRTPVAAAVLPSPAPAVKGGGTWKVVAGLVVLFGIGIGAGLWVTHGSDEDTAAPEPVQLAPAAAPDATVAEPAIVPVDAAVAEVPVDAAVARPVAEEPPTKPPVKKPPVKKPPIKKPPAPQPTRDCDPFANPHGCD
ncbi:MAG: protein kinase [Kofleriaceae bacterium]|nr:protein kinase [Kofleriaceae bacterium]